MTGKSFKKKIYVLPPMSTCRFHDKGKVDWDAVQQVTYNLQDFGAVTTDAGSFCNGPQNFVKLEG